MGTCAAAGVRRNGQPATTVAKPHRVGNAPLSLKTPRDIEDALEVALASERKSEGGKGRGCGSSRNLGAHLALHVITRETESSHFRFAEWTEIIIADVIYFRLEIMKNKILLTRVFQHAFDCAYRALTERSSPSPCSVPAAPS